MNPLSWRGAVAAAALALAGTLPASGAAAPTPDEGSIGTLRVSCPDGARLTLATSTSPGADSFTVRVAVTSRGWSGRLTWFQPRGPLDSDVVRLDLEPAADGDGEEAVAEVPDRGSQVGVEVRRTARSGEVQRCESLLLMKPGLRAVAAGCGERADVYLSTQGPTRRHPPRLLLALNDRDPAVWRARVVLQHEDTLRLAQRRLRTDGSGTEEQAVVPYLAWQPGDRLRYRFATDDERCTGRVGVGELTLRS